MVQLGVKRGVRMGLMCSKWQASSQRREMCIRDREPGMVLAIEPMINLGTYKTRQMPDGWLVCTRDGKPSAHFEKTVAITEDGPLVLTTEEGHRRPV